MKVILCCWAPIARCVLGGNVSLGPVKKPVSDLNCNLINAEPGLKIRNQTEGMK